MAVKLYKGDLPTGLDLGSAVAVDTETLGLVPRRDKLCLVQLSSGDGNAHLVQLDRTSYDAPNLKALFTDPAVTKIFHCTKIASKLTRTYTDRHGLKDLVKELLGIELNKQQQSSDWGAHMLSDPQKQYAAQDVIYLHELKSRLDQMLAREDRAEIARACFAFIPTRAALDLAGWTEDDVFAH